MAPTDWPPKFTLDTGHILNLFVGERFYSSADAAIREAVLNSIDACGRRRSIEPNISPQIEIEFDEQANTMSISDNGDGMGKFELSELFAKVGSTASELAKQDEELQYKAVGEFGIGVVSYFLICDKFQVHTVTLENEKPLALEFDREMLDGEKVAKPVPAHRKELGTTIEFILRDSSMFTRLLEKFSYWVRNVEGLQATKLPDKIDVPQGGLSREIQILDVDLPDWIERARLGPPTKISDLMELDGNGHIDVLYRGVFVQRIDVSGLWAVEGSIDIDPKQFTHKLNREGFVGQELQEQVTRFLQANHPKILESALPYLREIIGSDTRDDWNIQRRATLWLAIPRTDPYIEAARAWDDEFHRQKAFRLLESSDRDREVSLAELVGLGGDRLYIAPFQLARTTDLTRQAVRVLRARGDPILQGVGRDVAYIPSAPLSAPTTADLLMNVFAESLPELVRVEDISQDVVSEDSEAVIYDLDPKVMIVRLGADASALVGVGKAIWINMEADAGRSIIQEILSANQGHHGLWLACLRHAPSHAHEIAPFLVKLPEPPVQLGLVHRQFLRRLIA